MITTCPHALVSSDVTRNMFTTNSGLIIKRQVEEAARKTAPEAYLMDIERFFLVQLDNYLARMRKG